jgi:uncharacterized protein (TIGR04255 family)
MPRNYARAPIAEAVIDLRIDTPEGLSVSVFAELQRRLEGRFPDQLPIRTIEMGFMNAGETEAQFHTAQDEVGVRLQSKSGDRVLQAQLAGFTLSHMAPYTNWEAFRSEAQSAWSVYLEATGALRVTRCAVRVINKLQLPNADVGQYTRFTPSIPAGPLGPAKAFFMQLQLPLDHVLDGGQALVNVATAPQEHGTALVLDFDLFVTRTMAANSAEVWSILNSLSSAKNELFELSITDKTREMIS